MTTGLHYTFTRHRGGAGEAFRPDGRGECRLTLRSLADDALEIGSVRAGVLEIGDGVSVSRGGAVIFRGTVSVRTWHGWRGSSVEEGFTVHGPWRRLSRVAYTQLWTMMVHHDDPEGYSLQQVPSSRTVLNQDNAGLPVTLRAQVLEIIGAAAAAGIVAAPQPGDVAAIPEGLALPFDEGRDMTLAQALARELRYTPRLAVRFDYAEDPPRLRVVEPAGVGADAPWLAAALAAGALLNVREAQDGLPPLGCLLEITETGNVNGGAYAVSSAQTAGDVSDPERTLRAVLPVAGTDVSRDTRTLDLKTADLPGDLNDAAFWRKWHSDLRTAPEVGLTISGAERTGAGDNPQLYPRFVITAGVGMAELEEAGVTRFRVEMLTCTARITTYAHVPDGNGGTMGVESAETAELSLEVIATDATTRKYSWTEAFDYTGPEFVPPGLAAALLAAHQADGMSAEVTLALAPGAGVPAPGDTRAGLAAQSVAVDFRALTAAVAFGPPAPLGAADLAGFLTAFRNLRRSENHARRATGEAGADAKDETLDFLPSTSSGFKKTADHKVTVAAEQGGNTATVDPAKLPADNNKAELREVEYVSDVDADGNPVKSRAYFLVNEPRDADAAGPDEPPACDDHPGGGGGVGGSTDGGVGGNGGAGSGNGVPGEGDGTPANPCPPADNGGGGTPPPPPDDFPPWWS